MIKLLFFTFIIISSPIFSEEGKPSNGKTDKSQLEKEMDSVNFKNIKKILQADMLGEEVQKKESKSRVIKNRRLRKSQGRYEVPTNNDFWSFASELWLVKNAAILKWDFRKPEYGIEDAFKYFLESIGHLEKRFKVILLDSPNITHFALPSDEGHYIFILSVPFIRTLDLSKLEISLILFEDYLRANNKYFKNYVMNKELEKQLGSNFYKSKKLDTSFITNLHKRYDEFTLDKGFTFQQQFHITKQMEGYLKNDLRLFNSYVKMLRKIDDLVKTNLLYSKYLKLYPSPEIQLGWLNPEKKKI
jgi:hypothetical protein